MTLRETRASLGLTQTQWAEMLGVTREHVAAIEGGKREPSVTLARLADAIAQGYRPAAKTDTP